MYPEVSIVVPNYNHGFYLVERIESILNQSFQNFELILLDDCSTDNSRDIIERYRLNGHVSHVVFNERNTHNTFEQWTKGIRLAKGKYVWIAESDDVAEHTLLETLVNELERNPKAVVAYCHSLMIDSKGNKMDMTWHKRGSSGETYIYESNDFLRHKMLINNHIYNASMAVFRKTVFFQIPSDYQKYPFCGDWLFWVYVCQQGLVIEVCQKLNRYRQHENKVSATSVSTGKNWQDNAGVMRKIMDLLQLTPIQRKCVRGRWTKRFNSSNGKNLLAVKEEFPDLLRGTKLDIVFYEIGKIFGFLKV